jgi:hypothetical protein
MRKDTQKTVYYVGEGFYKIFTPGPDMEGYFHFPASMRLVSESYINQKKAKQPLLMLTETRYPYTDYVKVLDDLLSLNKFDIKTASIFIFTQLEPRAATYSYWIPYLIHKYGVNPKQIVYLNTSYCELDAELDVKVVTRPTLPIKFATNHDNLSMYDPTHEINMYLHTKDKLFSSLVRRLNISRVLATAALIKNFDEKDYVLSCGVDGDMSDKQILYYDRIAASTGFGLDFCKMLPMRLEDSPLDVTNPIGNQFQLTHPSLRECVFEVVHETVGQQCLFMEQSVMTTDNFFSFTEKSFRHAYNLQIPIFINRRGFYEYFYKTFDQEPHVGIPWKEWDKIDNYHTKVNEVVKFLKEMQKKDLYNEIVLPNKEIFRKNSLTLHHHAVATHIHQVYMTIDAVEGHWNDNGRLDRRAQKYLSVSPPEVREIFNKKTFLW